MNSAVAEEGKSLNDSQPIIIAHRGASGLMPEHTIPGYRLAIRQQADYVEPDLVMTSDGHFVARHDIYLSETTDVANHPEFADRKRTLEGHTDWFVHDFTLEELKTLRAVQPRKNRDQNYNGQFEVPTLDEIVTLMQYEVPGKEIGLYIEMKRPQLFEEIDPDLASALAKQLNAIVEKGYPVYFQCFDGAFLRKIAPLTSAKLILLEEGVKDKATKHYKLDINLSDYFDVADGFGLYKVLLVDANGQPNGLVQQLHDAGKLVHVWTARDDALPKGFKSGAGEIEALLNLGVDGVFTDFAATGIVARERHQATKE